MGGCSIKLNLMSLWIHSAPKYTVLFQGVLAELKGLLCEVSDLLSHMVPHCNILEYLGMLAKRCWDVQPPIFLPMIEPKSILLYSTLYGLRYGVN